MFFYSCIVPQQYHSITFTVYLADYDFSLIQVERPENAKERYGEQKIDTLTDKKYKTFFEDDLVKILWVVSNEVGFEFLIENKTDHTIKIVWDEATYMDEKGMNHKIMHSGIKYNDREKSQPPSNIIRKGKLEDLIFPIDNVYFDERWNKKSLFLSKDFHSEYDPGIYHTFEDFQNTVNKNLNNNVSVLLPIQIENVTNDYIFTFQITNIETKQRKHSDNVN